MGLTRFRMKFVTSPPLLLFLLFVIAMCLGEQGYAEEVELEPDPEHEQEEQAQQHEYMRALRMADFESESELAKRANDLTQLDPRDSDTLLWGGSLADSAYLILFSPL